VGEIDWACTTAVDAAVQKQFAFKEYIMGSMIKSSLTTWVCKTDPMLCVVVAHVCLPKPQPSNLHLPPTIPVVGLLLCPLLDSQCCFNDLK